MNRQLNTAWPLAAALATAAVLAGCGGAKTGDADTLTVEGAVPLAYVKRSTEIRINPTGGAPFAAGGDLMLREKSSPSAPEYNLTERFTQGKGDASDPEVSYDGKKIIFSMRCPADNTATITVDNATVPACTGRWNIWEYDMSAGGFTGGTFRRLTASTQDDDVDPAYLPAGRGFVFSSNRQAKAHLDQALGHSYYALDEYERERVFNLHTMDAQGGGIQQITFNQSHDRNPVVRPNGDIMFSRWEHMADKNRFAVFRVKPDGTDLFVFYGAQSPGNSFLHPRDMDPKSAKYSGFIASSLMPLQRTQEGGALMFIDAANYSEQNTPANTTVPAAGGQSQPTPQPLSMERGLALNGRITTPYPLWDGTDRVLLSYRPCTVTKNDQVVPCATLTTEEIASLTDETMTAEQRAAAPIRDDAPASYGIYMFDPSKQSWQIVAAPPAGFMLTDPIPLLARDEPNVIPPALPDDESAKLAARNEGLIEVRSVYDTDGLNRMAEQMLVAADRPAGCTLGIAQTTPQDPMDTRASVADLVKIKDPGNAAYNCTPVRWVRAVRAIAPPAGMTGIRSAIGETNFEQQQILGYAPIEPDGSFKLQIPADTPIGLQVMDTQGRAIQTHTNWIQVRPGERRTCDGCHSPRRGGAINSGSIVNSMPDTLVATLRGAHQTGETMAAVRTRLDATLLRLGSDMVYSDVWADRTKTGVTARASISLRYTGNVDADGNPDPANDLATAVPTDGVINYPDHIQPLWTRSRGTNGANTCTNCHNDPAKLDLRGTISGSGRLVSYQELLVGDPVIDPATGLPKTHLEDGVPVIDRQPALVETSSGATNTAGQARKSRLAEILFGQTLLAGADARAAHPNPPATAPDHAKLLNKAELRLVSEWMDLGGQYYNNPFTATGVRTFTGLSMDSFQSTVFPILRSTCAAACHQAVGSDQTTPAGTAFRENRFVLTGDVEGDYGSTLSMINDVCSPDNNALLRRPSTIPHPAGATGQATAVLPAGSSAYNTIRSWISSGCTAQ